MFTLATGSQYAVGKFCKLRLGRNGLHKWMLWRKRATLVKTCKAGPKAMDSPAEAAPMWLGDSAVGKGTNYKHCTGMLQSFLTSFSKQQARKWLNLGDQRVLSFRVGEARVVIINSAFKGGSCK